MVTNEQLYLAIGVPVVLNITFTGFLLTFMYNALNHRVSLLEVSLKETWRAELRRVEELLDARLKHLEERSR